MWRVDTAMIEQAFCGLGWDGDVIGPVAFGGIRFWAAVRADEASGSGDPRIRLVGALTVGGNAPALQEQVSLLAAYSPRAILVPSAVADLETLVNAAVLDQGVVVHDGGEVRVLASAGPRTWVGRVTEREQRLLDCVRSALPDTSLAVS